MPIRKNMDPNEKTKKDQEEEDQKTIKRNHRHLRLYPTAQEVNRTFVPKAGIQSALRYLHSTATARHATAEFCMNL